MSTSKKLKEVKVNMNSNTSHSLWNISSDVWLSSANTMKLTAEALKKISLLTSADLNVKDEEVDEALGKNSNAKGEEFSLRVG